MKPWCVFYGTQVALIFAEDRTEAFKAFIEEAFPLSQMGRISPPALSEVKIRELRASDAGWIEEFDERASKPFLQALKGVQ